jgi:general secretion pathway protein I
LRRRRDIGGFTLLEVMVALAILGLALTAISRSQQLSIRAANRAKMMTVATMLARYKMVEVEDNLFDEGFSDFKKEDKGDFKKEGFDRFTYVLVIDKVELPQNLNAESLTSMFGGSAEEEKKEHGDKSPEGKMSTMMSMGAKMMAKQLEMFRNVLEQSIRRAQLKIEWKEGSKKRDITVVGYFTDPRKIDAALSPVVPGLPGGLPGATTPGATTPGATTPGATTPGATTPGTLRTLTTPGATPTGGVR